jgi:transposase
MPPTRTPLAPITPNRPAGFQLTPYERAKLIGRREAGQSLDQIAKETRTPKSTVKSTIDKAEYRYEGESQPRSGRPVEYTERDERILLRFARL